MQGCPDKQCRLCKHWASFFCWFVFLRDWCDSAGWHPLNLLALSTIQSSTHTILPYCFAFSFKNFIHEYNITGPFLPPRSPFQHPSASSLPHTHCPHFQLLLFFLFLTFFPFLHTAQSRICATPKVQTTYYLKILAWYPDSCWKNVLNLQIWWQILLPAETSNWPEKEIQYMIMKCGYFEFRHDYTRRSKGRFSNTCHDSVFLVKTEL